jgi:hypothetical protein
MVGGNLPAVEPGASNISAAEAVLDPTTGNLIAGFNANLEGGSAGINSMALTGTNLYLAGDFSTVNGVPAACLMAVSSASGSPVNWNPTPSPNRPSMCWWPPLTRYVGGHFVTISATAL